MIIKTIPISARIIISYVMKWGHPIVNLMERQWKLRQQHQNFPFVGEAIVEQILVSEEINKSKRAGL